jgi:hypothetical protein
MTLTRAAPTSDALLMHGDSMMASNATTGRRGVPWRLVGWGTAGALLLLPLVAMQFTPEVNWTLSDFIFAGVMFGIVGGTFELAVRASGNASYRLGAAIALVTAFLLVWINLAVGIIGNEDNPLNLMFFGVIAAALVGSVVARFKADGMSRAMTIAGVIQAAIGLGTFAFNIAWTEPPGAIGLLLLIEFFAGTWFASAWLFRKAARLEA